MCGLAVASAWDRLVADLVRAHVPSRPESTASALAISGTPGERAVAQARRMLDQGRAKDALQALLSIKAEEPVYPFSLQLREEARRALERGGPVTR